jgi:hypothetical protein
MFSSERVDFEVDSSVKPVKIWLSEVEDIP